MNKIPHMSLNSIETPNTILINCIQCHYAYCICHEFGSYTKFGRQRSLKVHASKNIVAPARPFRRVTIKKFCRHRQTHTETEERGTLHALMGLFCPGEQTTIIVVPTHLHTNTHTQRYRTASDRIAPPDSDVVCLSEMSSK